MTGAETPASGRPTPGPAARPLRSTRLFRGYGPLVAFALLFALMAAFVPSVGEQVRVVSTDAGGLGNDAGPGAADGDATGSPDGAATDGSAADGTPGAGSATGAGGSPNRAGTRPAGAANGPARSGGSGGAAPGTVSAAAGAPPAGAQPCPNRKAQVPNDTYSPPCLSFAGDNGGGTSRGVTATDIVVAARIGGLPDFSSAPSENGPAASFRIDGEEIKRTMTALAEYFSTRFQFYGRQLKMAFFDGKGSFTTELQGGGQEEVEADAVQVAEEIKAFAEMNGFTPPYADALARRQVVSFGTPHMSEEWLAEHRPYTWSPAVDCTMIQRTVVDYRLKKLAGRPAAHAGGALAGQTRRFAVLAPENPWYQQCVEAGEKVARAAGDPTDLNIKYKLDFATLSNQAASVVAKLKSDNITTVLCGCDPAFPIFLTAKAQEQGYEPEWIITGTALTDVDVFGQLYQQDQWSRAFGISFLGTFQPLRASYGYAAFKAVRPNEEPSALVDILYYQMYLLALGVQGAGPVLTPESFERGMYAYPGGNGPSGSWKFTPGRYTPQQDAREIYWDGGRTSAQNNEQGSYVETEPGKRYRRGEWPSGEPAVFPARASAS